MKDLGELVAIRISRFINIGQIASERKLQVHVFCDASERAYGAAVYIRDDAETESAVKLFLAKTKLAPLPKKSIPIARLELLAIVVGTLAARRVIEAYDG